MDKGQLQSQVSAADRAGGRGGDRAAPSAGTRDAGSRGGGGGSGFSDGGNIALRLAADHEVTFTYDEKTHQISYDYEGKDALWKLIYRAGKPAVDAARVAAQEWLKALGA